MVPEVIPSEKSPDAAVRLPPASRSPAMLTSLVTFSVPLIAAVAADSLPEKAPEKACSAPPTVAKSALSEFGCGTVGMQKGGIQFVMLRALM